MLQNLLKYPASTYKRYVIQFLFLLLLEYLKVRSFELQRNPVKILERVAQEVVLFSSTMRSQKDGTKKKIQKTELQSLQRLIFF